MNFTQEPSVINISSLDGDAEAYTGCEDDGVPIVEEMQDDGFQFSGAYHH